MSCRTISLPREGTEEKMKQDTYYAYLDGLRDSGLINMFGAAKYLEREFPELGHREAVSVLHGWMESHTQGGVC